MISTECDKCKDKAWCWSCNERQSKPLSSFVCKELITYRERERDIIIWLNIIMIPIKI